MLKTSTLITLILGFSSFALADTHIDKLELIKQARQQDLEASKLDQLKTSSDSLAARANVCEIINRIPSPRETVGLTKDAGNLWASSEKIPDPIFKINSTTGATISSFPPPGVGPRGLELVGEYLWNVDFYDNHIYKLTKTGSIVGGIDINIIPPSSQKELPLYSGIAWDGTGFWVTDWSSDFIYKISPDSGKAVASVLSPVTSKAYGLAWDGIDLWVSSEDGIYKIDPNTGNILIACTDFDFKYGQAYGLTWDGKYLWGGSWISNEIIKISVPPSRYQPPPAIIFLLLSGN